MKCKILKFYSVILIVLHKLYRIDPENVSSVEGADLCWVNWIPKFYSEDFNLTK